MKTSRVNFFTQPITGALFFSSFIGLIWLRFMAVSSTVNEYTQCTSNCVDWRLPAYDAIYVAIFILLIAFSHLGIRIIRIPLALTGIIFLTTYIADLFIYLLLNHRLNLEDAIRYSGQVKMNSTVALPQILSPSGIILFGLFIISTITLTIIIIKATRKPALCIILLTISPIFIWARNLPENSGQVSSHLYEDVLTYNLPGGVDTPYPKDFSSKSPKTNEFCTTSNSSPRSVILIIVESLSLYQSNHLSGLHNYLPNLDKIAKKYSHLESFYANGFTTDGGLIALLTSNVPLPGANRYASTNAYAGYEKPRFDAFEKLKQKNIKTAYFRSADQSFLDTGSWLRKIGFNYVEGPEHPFYANLPRGSFNEPGDKALYSRFLQWFDKERDSDLFFSVIQTTTSHPPFIIPTTGEKGEEAAMKYADESLGEFLSNMEKKGFFEDGTIIVTGDHRSMTALRKGESKAIGPDAHARIPAIIISSKHHGIGEIAGHWQQTDFLPSLLFSFGIESCVDDFTGRFLGPLAPAKYIMHVQGMDRDNVMVVTDSTSPSMVKLDGENTTWTDGAPTAEAGIVIDQINWQRSRLPIMDRDLAPSLLRWYGLENR